MRESRRTVAAALDTGARMKDLLEDVKGVGLLLAATLLIAGTFTVLVVCVSFWFLVLFVPVVIVVTNVSMGDHPFEGVPGFGGREP